MTDDAKPNWQSSMDPGTSVAPRTRAVTSVGFDSKNSCCEGFQERRMASLALSPPSWKATRI